MALIVSGITLPFEASEGDALAAAFKAVGVGAGTVPARPVRCALDLRRGQLNRVWSVALELPEPHAEAILAAGHPQIRPAPRNAMPSATGTEFLTGPPAIVGFGPAGLFAALVLAENGFRPHVIERGAALEERDAAVSDFFGGGPLREDTNIQFGEGGAGAYSDGKLTTRISDSRCALALRLLREYGAPEEALMAAKPHIGTDLLKGIVVRMRQRIIALGGRVDFGRKLTGLRLESGRLAGLETDGGDLPCQTAILAIGHSARDTFETLAAGGLDMRPKAFSVGLRIEHLQQWIDEGLYGRHAGLPGLPPGEYSLSAHVDGRGCYSFCMCPGGQVVAASSEIGGVAVNGMSFHARAGRNANAALCVSVEPSDLEGGLFAGVQFQRDLEQAAFRLGGGDYGAPVQRLEDFMAGRKSTALGAVAPSYPRGYAFADLNALLPGFVRDGLHGAMGQFARKIRGFDHPDAVLTGVESRTSSPVRMSRNDATLWAPGAAGLIPCGEGTGYAGGIMSAAVDGIRAAEGIMGRYRAE